MECIYPERPTIIEALDMLEAIGRSEAIAGYLRKMGIKALPQIPCACAVNRFVHRVTGAPVEHATIRVLPSIGSIGWVDVVVGRFRDTLLLQEHTNRFANDFDDREYPELIHASSV
jgi:hypothetical protein